MFDTEAQLGFARIQERKRAEPGTLPTLVILSKFG
jgi:hypothetical protein